MSVSSSRRFPLIGLIAFGLLAALLLVLAVLSTLKGMRTAESFGEVVSVQDGQTVVVNLNGEEQTMRLAGIMAPLPAGEGQEPGPDQCLAQESLDHLRTVLEPGESVRLEFPDQRTGPHGTVLAQLHHAGKIVNVQQVQEGLAVALREQPLAELGEAIRTGQAEARAAQKGLYSSRHDCTLNGRITPILKELEDPGAAQPISSTAAGEQIDALEQLIERGTAAQKVIAAVQDEGSTVSSLAWAQDKAALEQRLNEALQGTQARLVALQNTRESLVAAEARQRAEEARKAEEARQREIARQREAARQEAERQRAAAEQRRQQEEARRKAEASASASPTPTPSDSAEPSESPSASPSASATPSSTPTESPSAAPSESPSPSPTPAPPKGPPASPGPPPPDASAPDDDT